MTDHFSPMVTWNLFGSDYWTKIYLTITDPNPDRSLVTINWAVQGGNSPTVKQTYCAWIEGYRTASDTYADHKDGVVAIGKKWTAEVGTGLNDPANPDMGSWFVHACCRVEDIDDGTNNLRVKLHNYLEYSASNWLTPLVFVPTYWSATQVVVPQVRKV